MKKKTTEPKELNESQHEEFIRLRAENEYIKTEIAAIKKGLPLDKKRKLRVSRRKSSDYQRT